MRWGEVAAALGADNGYAPMPLRRAEELWKQFGYNRRWAMAVDAIRNSKPVPKEEEAPAIEGAEYRIPGTMELRPEGTSTRLDRLVYAPREVVARLVLGLARDH